MSLTTKRALVESLKQMLNQRSLSKITVKDLVERCGVNRQTFYYHFHDIYDLMEWTIQDDADRILSEKLDYSDWKWGVASVLRYLQENRNLVLNIYHSVSHEAIARYLKRLLRPYILQVICSEMETLEYMPCEEDVDFLADIYTLAVIGIIMEWISREMEMNGTEERVKKLFAATDGSFAFMLENLKRKREEEAG